jgi:hypothetical protein
MRLCLFIAIVVGACWNSGTTPGPDPAPQTEPERSGPSVRPAPPARPLAELGAEFRRLRATRTRTGERWKTELDGWGGRLHQVMDDLLARLGLPGTGRTSVIAMMGQPDELGKPGTDLWWYGRGETVQPEPSEMLVYHWRGRHDFLYFYVRDDRVVRAGWWMAGE